MQVRTQLRSCDYSMADVKGAEEVLVSSLRRFVDAASCFALADEHILQTY